MSYREQDLVYAAASIDCDGHITIASFMGRRSIRPSFSLRVGVRNCNPILTDWFKETFGGYCGCRGGGKPNWRPSYSWCITCQQACSFLQEILPFLKLKNEQAKIAIELQKRIYQIGGKPVLDEEIDARMAMKEAMNILNQRGAEVEQTPREGEE